MAGIANVVTALLQNTSSSRKAIAFNYLLIVVYVLAFAPVAWESKSLERRVYGLTPRSRTCSSTSSSASLYIQRSGVSRTRLLSSSVCSASEPGLGHISAIQRPCGSRSKRSRRCSRTVRDDPGIAISRHISKLSLNSRREAALVVLLARRLSR